MTDNFVGFAKSPKPDSTRKIHSKEFEIQVSKPFSESHFVFTTQEGLGSWLGEITKFDFRPGGKLKYQHNGENFGATYSAIVIPKQVVLVTETLGEVIFSAKVQDNYFELNLSFKKNLKPDEVTAWEMDVLTAKDKIVGALS